MYTGMLDRENRHILLCSFVMLFILIYYIFTMNYILRVNKRTSTRWIENGFSTTTMRRSDRYGDCGPEGRAGASQTRLQMNGEGVGCGLFRKRRRSRMSAPMALAKKNRRKQLESLRRRGAPNWIRTSGLPLRRATKKNNLPHTEC